jgi:hypothetical protein
MVMPLAWTFDMRTSLIVLSSAFAVAPIDPATGVEAVYFRNTRRCLGTSPKALLCARGRPVC